MFAERGQSRVPPICIGCCDGLGRTYLRRNVAIMSSKLARFVSVILRYVWRASSLSRE